MPSLASVSKIDFPNRIDQNDLKTFAREFFSPAFPEVDRMLGAFDNTGIQTRNLCKPLEYYRQSHTFQDQNAEYIKIALEYSVQAISMCLEKSGIAKDAITDLIFVSTTGLATPSLDALIINQMRLGRHTSRTPVFGLGCAGGVGGFSKACTLAKANPDAVVAFVAVELCSLTFLRNDFSKSNFIGSSLFGDGVAACLIVGDNYPGVLDNTISFVSSKSTLYYDSLDVMGWTFLNEGFKVLFSQDIPKIIAANVHTDVTSFLADNNLGLPDVANFIFHPGGKKVLAAYEEALPVQGDFLKNTREVMNENGNLSSATVLYVLERFASAGFTDGYGMMMSMGPGFSSEMALLRLTGRRPQSVN